MSDEKKSIDDVIEQLKTEQHESEEPFEKIEMIKKSNASSVDGIKDKVKTVMEDPKITKTVDSIVDAVSDTADNISDFVKNNKTIQESAKTVGQVANKGIESIKDGVNQVANNPTVVKTVSAARSGLASAIENGSDRVVKWLRKEKKKDNHMEGK